MMVRLLKNLTAFLILGAVANVAVAWGLSTTASFDWKDDGRLTKEPGNLTRVDCFGGQRVYVGWGHGCFGVPPPDPESVATVLPSWLLERTSYPLASDERIWDELTVEHRSAMYDARGWPMLGQWGWMDFPGRLSNDYIQYHHGLLPTKQTSLMLLQQSKYFPFYPVWPGFAINTIFYAAILWLLFFAPGSVRRAFRRRRGLCPACAYPIGTSPVCTECGRALKPRMDTNEIE